MTKAEFEAVQHTTHTLREFNTLEPTLARAVREAVDTAVEQAYKVHNGDRDEVARDARQAAESAVRVELHNACARLTRLLFREGDMIQARQMYWPNVVMTGRVEYIMGAMLGLRDEEGKVAFFIIPYSQLSKV